MDEVAAGTNVAAESPGRSWNIIGHYGEDLKLVLCTILAARG